MSSNKKGTLAYKGRCPSDRFDITATLDPHHIFYFILLFGLKEVFLSSLIVFKTLKAHPGINLESSLINKSSSSLLRA